MQVLRVEGEGPVEPLPGAPSAPLEDRPTPYPLVMVQWQDAWFDFDLETPEDARLDYPVRTAGFLVSDGPRALSIAQEVLPAGEGFRAVTHIPIPLIERVDHLDLARPAPDGPA